MPSRTALIWAGAATAAFVVGGAGVLIWALPDLIQQAPAPVVAVAPAEPQLSAAASAPPAVAAPTAIKPTFDVVRVEPTGEAVIAGRAAPDAKVALLDRGRTLAETQADAHGEFVLLPPPLSPGAHLLTLSAGAGGPDETSNIVPLTIAPPPAAAPATSAPAAPATTAPPPAAPPSSVKIGSAETSAAGGLVAKGSAAPNAVVRLYVSGAYVGDARTKDDGRWSLTVTRGLTAGPYALRADAIGPQDAKVVARAEAPFVVPALSGAPPPAAPSRPASSAADVVVDSLSTHHVAEGDTLWDISRTIYGDGARFAVIFSANSGQIRDPNLIYPGQTFVVPKGEPPP